MADRFPSLDDFDPGAQTDPKDVSSELSADNFLAREKAILGDDADQFATSADATAFADNEILGGQNAQSTFNSQFPEIGSGEDLATAGVELPAATGPSVTYNSGFTSANADAEEETDVVREWRERRDAALAKRAEQLADQRGETIKEARQNIDDFYENYNAKKEKSIAQTRKEAEQFLTGREDTVSGGTSWDRIAKLVDVSGKGARGGAAGSGKERFREMLMGLRKDEKAPGAVGY